MAKVSADTMRVFKKRNIINLLNDLEVRMFKSKSIKIVVLSALCAMPAMQALSFGQMLSWAPLGLLSGISSIALGSCIPGVRDSRVATSLFVTAGAFAPTYLMHWFDNAKKAERRKYYSDKMDKLSNMQKYELGLCSENKLQNWERYKLGLELQDSFAPAFKGNVLNASGAQANAAAQAKKRDAAQMAKRFVTLMNIKKLKEKFDKNAAQR